MPIGELYINGVDAYEEYGLSMESSALSALMTPPPNKEYIENKSRNEHGKKVVNVEPRVDERDLNLPVHIVASSRSEFLSKYSRLCEVFANGSINISTSYQSDKVYRCNYISCSQFAEYRQKMAKFTLRLNEPNPYDRNP